MWLEADCSLCIIIHHSLSPYSYFKDAFIFEINVAYLS